MQTQIKDLGITKIQGVYGFFAPHSKIKNLQNALSEFRKNRDQKVETKNQAIPKPNLETFPKSGCLYIGKVAKTSLEKRILEHLCGATNHKTGALKLNLWAKQVVDEVTINYIVIPHEQNYLIDYYEAALWNYYQPAIGKR